MFLFGYFRRSGVSKTCFFLVLLRWYLSLKKHDKTTLIEVEFTCTYAINIAMTMFCLKISSIWALSSSYFNGSVSIFGREELSCGWKTQGTIKLWQTEGDPLLVVLKNFMFTPILGEMINFSGQIIATSHDLTPNGGLVREFPLFQGNLGWWNIIIWPDFWLLSRKPTVRTWKIDGWKTMNFPLVWLPGRCYVC